MTNNADMPAMPFKSTEAREINGEYFATSVAYHGISKREYFAGLAMQGIMSDQESGVDAEDAAILACDCADELLAQLERTK